MAKAKAPKAKTLREQMDADAAVQTETLDIVKLRECADRLAACDAEIAQLSAKLTEVTKERRTLAEQTLPDLFDESGGVGKLTLGDGRVVELKTEYYPNVTKANESRWFEWLKENDLDGIIKNEIKTSFGKGEDATAEQVAQYLQEAGIHADRKRYVHAQTLKAFVRERMDRSAPLPPEVDINAVRFVKIS